MTTDHAPATCPTCAATALDHALRTDPQAPLPLRPVSDPWVDAGEWNVRRDEWVAAYRCRRSTMNLEATVPMVGKRKPSVESVRACERAVCAVCRQCDWAEGW